MNPFLHLIIGLVILGFVLWLVRTYIPMDPIISNLLSVVIAIGVLLWLLKWTGLWSGGL